MNLLNKAIKDHFTIVYNSVAQDQNLTIEAKGLYLFMASQPTDWVFHKDWIRKNHPKLGRDKLNKVMNDLIENGYLTEEETRTDDGKFSGKNWVINPVKNYTNNPVKKHTNELNKKHTKTPKNQVNKGVKPLTEKPLTEKPLTANPHLQINIDTNKDLQTTTTSKTPPKFGNLGSPPKNRSSSRTKTLFTLTPECVAVLFQKFLDQVATEHLLTEDLLDLLRYRHNKFNPQDRTKDDYVMWMKRALRMALEDLASRPTKHRTTQQKLMDTSWGNDDIFDNLEGDDEFMTIQ
jgi:hypothetical protein